MWNADGRCSDYGRESAGDAGSTTVIDAISYGQLALASAEKEPRRIRSLEIRATSSTIETVSAEKRAESTLQSRNLSISSSMRVSQKENRYKRDSVRADGLIWPYTVLQ